MFTVCTEKEDPIKEEPNTEEPAEGNPNEGNPLTDGHVGPRGSIYDDPANGLYVAPNGNDETATGAIDKPYKRINKAFGAAKSGSTVILCSGVYREGVSVTVREDNITIKYEIFNSGQTFSDNDFLPDGRGYNFPSSKM